MFPKNVPELESLEELMPNIERSVKDCPFSIYGHGGVALASSIFVDRYVDKRFSHIVTVLNEEVTCVGLIVDENHVLTTSECASSEDDSLPRIKLSNETLDAIDAAEKFPHAEYNVTLLRLNSSIVITKLALPTCFWDTDFQDGFDKIQTIVIAPNGSLALEETQCTYQNRFACMTELIQKSSLLQTRAIANYRMHPFVFTFGIEDTGDAIPIMKYIFWMETITKQKISSSECTAKYEEYRDYEDSMASRGEMHEQVQYSKSRLTTTNINQYRARIIPNTAQTESKRHCYGSLIAPKFILTAANCLKQYEV
uniref:Peptidase S1 domain-containing protein n=1 Tax=Anopheles maculatus TaxID=74869 RepID=A0A182T081_9DIPT